MENNTQDGISQSRPTLGSRIKSGLKAIALMLTGAALLFAAELGYNLYYNYVPVADEGQCIQVQTPQGRSVIAKIIKNKDAQSGLMIAGEVVPGVFMYQPDVVYYAQLRQAGAKVTDCGTIFDKPAQPPQSADEIPPEPDREQSSEESN